MKRLSTGLAAALVVGSAVVPIEAEVPYCKDRNCVDEVPGKLPDQPHTHQEAAESHDATEMVVIPGSPITTAPRNSPAHKEWIERYGEQGVLDIEAYTKLFLSDEY